MYPFFIDFLCSLASGLDPPSRTRPGTFVAGSQIQCFVPIVPRFQTRYITFVLRCSPDVLNDFAL